MPAYADACNNRFSWRLRFAVCEYAHGLCPFLTKKAINEELLGFYELLMRDAEAEVRSEAVANVPKVAAYCDAEKVVDVILPIMREQMSTDASQHVKGSLAQAICELSESISQRQSIEHIFPAVIAILTKESVTEVRISLLENLSKLAKAIGEDATIEMIIPEIEKLSQDQTWRVRLATISFIPKLLDFVTKQKFIEKVQPILLKYMEDSVHEIRLTSVNCLLDLARGDYFDLAWLEGVFSERLQTFSKHAKFAIRLHTLFMVNDICQAVSDKFLNDVIYQANMKLLQKDPVPNVRFNYAKTAELIYGRLSNSNKMDLVDSLRTMANGDSDFDVKFYAARALHTLCGEQVAGLFNS